MIHKIAGLPGPLTYSVTPLPVTWFYFWIYLNCPSNKRNIRLTRDVIHYMTSMTQLTQTSFKTTIYTIMNRITANIASHIC